MQKTGLLPLQRTDNRCFREGRKPIKFQQNFHQGRAPQGSAHHSGGRCEISAAELRLALGTTDMRSTLIDGALKDGNVSIRGVWSVQGMSQWGAFNMVTTINQPRILSIITLRMWTLLPCGSEKHDGAKHLISAELCRNKVLFSFEHIRVWQAYYQYGICVNGRRKDMVRELDDKKLVRGRSHAY